MSIDRRDLMKCAALVPLAWHANALGAQPPRKSTLGMRPRAFIINGKPTYLVIGSVDYFRCPHQLWREQLLRAKRSGINTISFCVAWNFHERNEGVFDFNEDADLGHFLDTCSELGLYAYPRVGPFICDEWEAGGHPAWLYGKDDIQLRADHAPTLRFVDRWFSKLIPIFASRQITRGGAVLLVQQENEYYFVGRSGVQEYQSKLIAMIRKYGIEVPITDCNGDSAETRLSQSLMTHNSGGAANVAKLRSVQPDKPAIITELYTDYLNIWGWPVTSYPTALGVFQQTMETVAAGGMYSYFMLCTGTNFGFWASTSWKSDESFVTTRYYERAPIGEGGVLNESYWFTKAVNLIVRGAEEFLTAGEPDAWPGTLLGPVKGTAVKTPKGFLLFVSPQYPERVGSVYHTDGRSGPIIQTSEERPFSEVAQQVGVLALPSLDAMPLAEASSYPSMLPYGLQIAPDVRIDYANASYLGLAGGVEGHYVLLRGDGGSGGIISINGHRREFVFDSKAPVRIEVAGIGVMGLARELADRTWFAEGRVLIGPQFVGDQRGHQHECFLDAEFAEVTTISAQGTVESKSLEPVAEVAALVPLQKWSALPCPEILAQTDGWRSIDGPTRVEKLGAYLGYTWYRAIARSTTARKTGLLFSHARDRVTVFANGKRAGVWGSGRHASRDPLPVDLAAGQTELLMLCDNMGRVSEGALPDYKGIFGPVYLDAEVTDLPSLLWVDEDVAPTNSWPFLTYRQFSQAWSLSTATEGTTLSNLHRTSFRVSLGPGEGRKLSLLALPRFAWVMVDDQVIGEHAGDLSLAGGFSFSSFLLDPAPLAARTLKVDIVVYGDLLPDMMQHVRMHSYRRGVELTDWQFKSWTQPTREGNAVLNSPTCWKTVFERPNQPGPWFLVTEGLSKGQAYLNNQALGRYWEIGPQHTLYMPDPWFAAKNELVIFDEDGVEPRKVYLSRDPRKSSRGILI